ncbi:histidine--tRNA ligase [Periweissella ghanensis]|uniref:Histidine--tRNA ligase n=1 Tax=Periweissella ghanensis TaxID=467997 RepID=A0ABM8ZCC7_9LACO|nr:histidine--tRNA ligase [Periweissella ghanensis]MCM0600579.1 histidine--tRNA ligase [Periweissella ghanensis]CAH0418338.1 Histidine--tRNA ligase [Periweissella ghanensis]
MAKQSFQKPKGTADLLPGDSLKWHYVEETARLLFNNYQYNEIRTPLFENFEVFSRSAGDTSDVVTKEMYDFHDKGDRHIALRPEGTAGVVRAFVENKLFAPEQVKPYKVFYIGPMFRYERPQAGRMRQFHQIGVEAFGADSPALDAEVIAMAIDFFQSLGLTSLKVAVNTLGDAESRAAYRQALIDYLEPHAAELSADSQERLHKNPLRVLDSKDAKDQVFVENAPSILDYLTPDAQAHWDKLKTMLDALGLDYEVDASMVRGLDYYNHTIFEIMTNSKALGHGWTTISGGGRYNGLVEELGGPETSGIGFGIGLERLMLLLESEQTPLPEVEPLDFYVANIGEETDVEALKLVQGIRSYGYTAERDYLDRKPKAQFKAADRLNALYVVTIGPDELANQEVNLKNMETGEQVKVPLAKIYTELPFLIENEEDALANLADDAE